ncbi:hypothetical protein RR48_07244 [Papilio machaon]|uniref:Uncharacterized protein n=1 Tax=Papilio machaon TaxID=76193 RepID=A0A194RMG2_PAPMA|nr:hypothetical protein RR48_07244 [Papilio machaon]
MLEDFSIVIGYYADNCQFQMPQWDVRTIIKEIQLCPERQPRFAELTGVSNGSNLRMLRSENYDRPKNLPRCKSGVRRENPRFLNWPKPLR